MSDDNGDNGETSYDVSVQVGAIEIEASGDDPEEVERLVDEKLDDAIDHATDLGLYSDDDTFHVEAGAGYMIAHGDGETPEEAYAQWEAMWDRMMEDVSELSAQEREQAGLAR